MSLCNYIQQLPNAELPSAQGLNEYKILGEKLAIVDNEENFFITDNNGNIVLPISGSGIPSSTLVIQSLTLSGTLSDPTPGDGVNITNYTTGGFAWPYGNEFSGKTAKVTMSLVMSIDNQPAGDDHIIPYLALFPVISPDSAHLTKFQICAEGTPKMLEMAVSYGSGSWAGFPYTLVWVDYVAADAFENDETVFAGYCLKAADATGLPKGYGVAQFKWCFELVAE